MFTLQTKTHLPMGADGFVLIRYVSSVRDEGVITPVINVTERDSKLSQNEGCVSNLWMTRESLWPISQPCHLVSPKVTRTPE